MQPNPLQPISVFSKTNQAYRILDMTRLPGTTNAIQEIMTYCMSHQEFIVPNSIISTLSDVLQVSERTVKTGLAQLEETQFIVERRRKSCVVNGFMANKFELIPRHLCSTIVQPSPCTPKELEIIEKVNEMRNYNQALNHPAYVQTIDQMTLHFAKDAVFNQKMSEMSRELRTVREELSALKSDIKQLIGFIRQDDLPKAKSFLTLINAGN